MKKLEPLNLYAIEVPIEAETYKISSLNYACYSIGTRWYVADEQTISGEILGTVTADTIDFDVEPFVPEEVSELHKEMKLRTFKQVYFRLSLLQANGLHFVNPYGKTQPFAYDEYAGTEREYLPSNWQTAENALIKKLLIIQPK